jgi:hypothetical protein
VEITNHKRNTHFSFAIRSLLRTFATKDKKKVDYDGA